MIINNDVKYKYLWLSGTDKTVTNFGVTKKMENDKFVASIWFKEHINYEHGSIHQ